MKLRLPQNSFAKALLLGCALPLLLVNPVQAGCTEVEIRANIEKFDEIDDEAIERWLFYDEPITASIINNCYEEAIPFLIETLEDTSKSIQTRAVAAWSMGGYNRFIAAGVPTKLDREIFGKALDALVNVLSDANSPELVRSNAADSLGSITMGEDSPEAIAALVDVLSRPDPSELVRSSAADSLGIITMGENSPEAIAVLVDVLSRPDPSELVRSNAASSLGMIGEYSEDSEDSPEAISALVGVLSRPDPSESVRENAVFSLGKIEEDSPEAIAILVEVLLDVNNSEKIRVNAALSLGSIGERDSKAIAALVDILADPKNSKEVRLHAAGSLGNIAEGSPDAIAVLVDVLSNTNDDELVRDNAAGSLGAIAESDLEAIAVLVDVLSDAEDDELVRRSAAGSLGAIAESDLEAIAVLVDVLSNTNDDELVRRSAAGSLRNMSRNIQANSGEIETPKLQKLIAALKFAREPLKEATEDTNFYIDETVISDLNAYLRNIETEIESRQQRKITEILGKAWIAHVAFWIALIFLYPRFAFVQAIFFWNPYVRKFFGLGYVGLALTWVPFLRAKLFEPFKPSLLADANLENFNSQTYFPRSHVKRNIQPESIPIQNAIPELKGQLVLEGESGLGKSMFLKYLVATSRRIVVFLPAKKCEGGVMEAIRAKLHGQAEDADFLRNLVYSGAIDICIDGLNEVTPDTRAKISSFVERYFKGNIILTTQPIEWQPPATATANVYSLQPLEPQQIEEFLISRQAILPADAPVSGMEYAQTCQNYLAQVEFTTQTEDEKIAVRRMLSNPMELTVVAQMLANRETPDLLNLQQQQYDLMAADYKRKHLREFPLDSFSEMVYQMRLNDATNIEAEKWSHELPCLKRFKMVLHRKFTDTAGKVKEEWYFRHDKIAEFFIVQTFLEKGSDRPEKHIGDPRFRGVYFLLATLLPFSEAMELREMALQYAASTQDYTLIGPIVQLVRSRRAFASRYG